MSELTGMDDLVIHGWLSTWVERGKDQWYEAPWAYLFTSARFVEEAANA